MDLVTLIDEHRVSVTENSAASRFMNRLLGLWMNRFYTGLLDGKTSSESNERLMRQALCNFGKKRPSELFTMMDGYFVQKAHRKSALRFLCDFIQGQPPHLHQILHTPLFGNLLACLQQDTSTTIVSAALTTLIMLLPHMPSSLVPHLPALFSIYGRLLFWDRERLRPSDHSGGENGGTESHAGWEVATFETEIDDQNIAHLSDYYTILYGLYPINFMDYIRKPQRYMRHANAAFGDELEVQPTEMRHRSEVFRRNHLLHPNFYSLTIDTERTDLGRWINCEAAEVVAECVGLCTETGSHSFNGPWTAVAASSGRDDPIPGLGSSLLADASTDGALLSDSPDESHPWRHSHSTAADSLSSGRTLSIFKRRSTQSSLPSQMDSFVDGGPKVVVAASPTLTASSSHTQLQELIQSNKTIKSGLHQSLPNDSVPSLVLGQQEDSAEKAVEPSLKLLLPPPLPPTARSLSSTSDMSTQVAHLQKQILLLQNDLSFERYLKQQHMAHIGDLRRKQMAEAATEAETQNLIMMNRNLKSRFEDAKKSEMQAKRESEKVRTMTKKWEADLTNRLKMLRDDHKKTHTDIEVLQKELHESRQECDNLRQLLCAAEVKELSFEQHTHSLEIEGSQVESLKKEVERLTQSERVNQAKDLDRQAAVDVLAAAEKRVETLQMELAAVNTDFLRMKTTLCSQIKVLQARLSEAQKERERPGLNADIAVENALAGSRAKQAELQKQYSLLTRKYTALQSSLLDMQSEQGPQMQPLRPSLSYQQQAEADYLALTASPVVIKSRPQRALSNAEAAGQNMTSLAGSLTVGSGLSGGDALSPVGSAQSGGDGSGSASASGPASPDARHFGTC